MGQATVDLPDPMGPPPATAGGTDELLAQLAGEEIDRLLAEADAEQAAGEKPGANLAPRANAEAGAVSPPAPGASSRGASLAEAADAELSAQLDNLFADLTVNAPDSPLLSTAPALGEPPGQSAAESPTATPAATPAISADGLIASAVAPVQPAAAAPPASDAPIKAPAAPLHPVEEELRATEALERGARPVSSAVPDDPTLTALASEETRPLPIFLRPLEWINAPLDACPESVRNVVGKVAILTTINALSILAYVFFFRRH